MNSASRQDEKDSSKQIAAVDQGGLSLPDRDYYIVDSPHFAEIRAAYVEHMKKMFTLAGDTPEQAAKEAAWVMEIETAMAKASMARVDRRDPEKIYHIYTVDDFQKMTPEFDWNAYFSTIGIGHFDTLNVVAPDFFKGLNALLRSEPLDAWKSYLRWQVLHGEASSLSSAFFDEDFRFFSRDPRRAKGAAAALEAMHSRHRRGAGRGRRPGLGQAELSPRGQGQHGQAGGRPRKSSGGTTCATCRG